MLKWLFDRTPDPNKAKAYQIELELKTTKNILNKEYVERFFSILEKWGSRFIPATIYDPDKPRPVKLNLDSPDVLVKAWQSEEGLSMQTYKKTDPEDYDLHWYIMAHLIDTVNAKFMPKISMSISEEQLGGNEADYESLLGLAYDLYDLIEAVYGYIKLQPLPLEKYRTFRPDIEYSIPDSYWVNFFGMPYVKMIGEEKIKSAGCHRVQRMTNGGIMLMLTYLPRESITGQGLAQAQVVKEHLGDEYFYHPSDGKHYGKVKRRTVPEFDWLSAPTELGPSAPVQPVGQASPEDFIGQVPKFVDNLKARMGNEGASLDYTKKSLQAIDEWFVRLLVENVPYDKWQSPEVEQELTAYLGEVMRRAFNGEWVVEQVKGEPKSGIRISSPKNLFFDPHPIVDEVLYEGVEESGSADAGMYETGLSAALWSWLSTRMPLEAIKDLFGR